MISEICDNAGAKHIRARIHPPKIRYVHGTGVFEMDYYWVEVYNAKTGKVVYRGDAFGWDSAVDQANRAVNVARWAWQMGLKAKELT